MCILIKEYPKITKIIHRGTLKDCKKKLKNNSNDNRYKIVFTK